MKHKTWFRLVIKAIGVLFFGFSIPHVCNAAAQLLMYLNSGLGVASWSYLLWFAGGLLQMGIGLYLFFGGEWIVNKCIPSNRPYCPECGYDLSHNSGANRCAECGVVLPMNDSK